MKGCFGKTVAVVAECVDDRFDPEHDDAYSNDGLEWPDCGYDGPGNKRVDGSHGRCCSAAVDIHLTCGHEGWESVSWLLHGPWTWTLFWDRQIDPHPREHWSRLWHSCQNLFLGCRMKEMD